MTSISKLAIECCFSLDQNTKAVSICSPCHGVTCRPSARRRLRERKAREARVPGSSFVKATQFEFMSLDERDRPSCEPCIRLCTASSDHVVRPPSHDSLA